MPSDIFGDPIAPDDLPDPPQDGPGLFGDPAPAAPARAPEPAPPATTPYRVLARKYRPQSFADLIGQEALVRTLKNAFAQGRVHHAFMLTGVRGVGKTTTARIIARALNCVGPDGKGGPTPEPCGVCAECRAILADRHPDVQELDAASNNGIDDVRELRERLRFRPAQGRFKVIILDEVHMMSTAAFNALLKTLEEPPPDVKFMLATTELRKVPTTILSRCQTFRLARVPQETLRAHFARICDLEAVPAEAEALAMVARAADGSVRDGLSILDQAIALAGGGPVSAALVTEMLGLADRGLALDLMQALMEGDAARALALAEAAHAAGIDPAVLLSDLMELVHLLSRMKTVPALAEDPALPEAERTRGAALAGKLGIPVLARAWQMLLKGLAEVAQDGVNRRAAAEMVLIRIAHLADMPTPGELVRRLTEAGAAPAQGPSPGPSPGPSQGGGLRAVAGGLAMAAPAPASLPLAAPAPVPQPASFREIVALASGRKPSLHAHLRLNVHPVRVSPGRIEIRPRPEAPRDLAQQLTALMQEMTGTRWTVSLVNEGGEPTLAEQGRTAEADRLVLAQGHPLVQAVLAAFPGARIEAVRDTTLDAYGLPPAMAADMASLVDGDGRDFAPPDALSAGPDDDFPQED
ncbi:DNA polymerase III subunit gamma/tau [Falsiroseomonas selenitidurans]|uniref:DNA polymerase III subunit gamma/tau n=1 Tax=Falsiroseomonas selenitidurans TaxID=2716335 RepID=A0ABX1E6E6_9PROT|nr:DNA polymerase III subunit gamma/tau [Falsiroseomonas selenitidurans]NKC32651.1 DNA polymerase III subunit gamma/tau [Falsiroseomonas selenitidurans]